MRVSFWLAIPLATVLVSAGCTKSTPASTGTKSCPNNLKLNSAGSCVECLQTSDCAGGTYCDPTGTCSACTSSTPNCPCASDTDCPTGQACGGSHDAGTLGACAAGCRTDSDCDGGLDTTCCSGVCSNTTSDPAANCGGCGKPACATGDLCCTGTCADTTNDSSNCGACGMACMTGSCANSSCPQVVALGLFDVSGNISADSTTTPIQVLKPLIYFTPGSNLQSLLTCNAFHFDTQNPPTAPPNAGVISITGYEGGVEEPDGGHSTPNQIDCAIESDVYMCGYGAVGNNGTPGTPPGEVSLDPSTGHTNVLGTGTITFAAAGGPDGGYMSFNTTAKGATGITTKEDLSMLDYQAGTDMVIHLNVPCAMDKCTAGGIIAVVQATSNSPAHFEEAAPAVGYIECVGTYGTIFGMDLGPAQITIPGSAIETMFGSDATLTTVATTVVTLSEGDLGNVIQGAQQIGVATTGSIGISSSAH